MSTALAQGGPEQQARLREADALGERGDVASLIALLDDRSWSVRRRAVAALARIGEAAVAPLAELLRDRRDNEDRIAAAVEALSIASTSSDAIFVALARHDDPAVAADGVQILGRRRDSAAVPVLKALLAHPDDNVAVAAIEALGRIGGRAAVDALLVLLHSDNFFRVFPVIDVLGRSADPRAIAPLTALLGKPHYAREAARALGRTGERQAVSPLCKVLCESGDSMVRVAAVALADLVSRHGQRYAVAERCEDTIRQACAGTQATSRLQRAVANADAAEQVAMCLVLGAIGEQSSVATLTQLLDRDPPVAEAAASALRKLGKQSDRDLLTALAEGDSMRRRVLLPLLGRRSALSDVSDCLTDGDPVVRALAADTLARIGTASVAPRLFPLLEDSNLRVVEAAVSAIQSLGTDATEPLAKEAARSPAPLVRRAALRILAYFGYASALPTFLDALSDPDLRVRDAALQGLPFVDDPRAIDSLVKAGKDPSARVRAAAMRSIGQCESDPRLESVLLSGLTDSEPWVRYYACQSLGKMACESAAPPISKLLEDPAGQVRVSAIDALSHLRSPIAEEALRACTMSEESDIQRAALIGLGIGRRASAVPLLLAALSHHDVATRLVALAAISSFPDHQVSEAIAHAARDPDEGVRSSAIGFLSSRPGREATIALIAMLRQPTADADRIENALTVVTEGRIAAILEALELADDDLAPRLTAVLARMHRADARAALVTAFSLSNSACRKAAATTLAALSSRDGVLALRRAAQSDIDPEVRQICALLLAD